MNILTEVPRSGWIVNCIVSVKNQCKIHFYVLDKLWKNKTPLPYTSIDKCKSGDAQVSHRSQQHCTKTGNKLLKLALKSSN